MRRGFRGLAFVAAVLVATAVTLTWQGTATERDRVEPAVLGASVERVRPTLPTSTATTTAATPSTGASTTNVSTTTVVPSPPAPLAIAAPSTTAPLTPTSLVQPVAGNEIVSQALAMVHFDWTASLPGWSIQFLGSRAGMRGATYPVSRVVQVYVRKGDSAADVAHAFAHELGHAVDVTYMDDQERQAFNVARGRPAGSTWWVAPSANDFALGAGDWAECFAWTMTGGVGGFFSRLGPVPNQSVRDVIAQLDH